MKAAWLSMRKKNSSCMNVILELEEQMKEFAKANKPPANYMYEEAMKRLDAKLYELAIAIELSAFDKYDIIEHIVTQGEILLRGLKRSKVIPLQLLYSLKLNDDES
eukprot:COSAG05_NODE_3417_length_2078_cov_1.649318_1_plen_105_part_10